MLTTTLIAIVAPVIFYEEPPVWSEECVAPLRSVIEGSSVTSSSEFLFSLEGEAISGSLDSDWYQRVESLYRLMVPLDTFPALTGIEGGGRPSIDLDGGRDTVTETLTGLEGGAVVRISIEVFSGFGAATAEFYDRTVDGEVWQDADDWHIPGMARMSNGTNVKTLVALVGRTCYEVTFASGAESDIDKRMMVAVADAVAFRAAHDDLYTGVNPVMTETVELENGASSPAKMVNGTLYVSVTDLVANGIECESTKTDFDKFCVISLMSGDFRVNQFSWKAKGDNGAKIEMGAPAIPYDGDLWVPASLVKN